PDAGATRAEGSRGGPHLGRLPPHAARLWLGLPRDRLHAKEKGSVVQGKGIFPDLLPPGRRAPGGAGFAWLVGGAVPCSGGAPLNQKTPPGNSRAGPCGPLAPRVGGTSTRSAS